MAANRPLLRWAWRLFRREWRRQALLVAALAVAVAAAVFAVTVAHNVGSPDGEFGSANHLLTFDGGDPRGLEEGLKAARARFPAGQVIGDRQVRIPGSVEAVDLRTQEPKGALGAPLLGLLRGRYPSGARQVAVTTGAARELNLRVGARIRLLGGRRRVVGIVENPQDLGERFVLAPPGTAGRVDFATVLLDSDPRSFEAFRGSLDPPARAALTDYRARSERHSSSASATFAVASCFLLLVSLIAGSGFAMIAQRRLRQLGMLGAIGATGGQLQLLAIATGAIVGAIGAAVGAFAGIALWVVAAPALESVVDHRIDAPNLPGSLIALVVLASLLGAVGAAWWPGRALARLPIGAALSGRPPRPRHSRRPPLSGAILIAFGCLALVAAQRSSPPLIVAGIVATIVGVLFMAPAAVRLLAACAGPMPVAIRLALRDLGRYRSRSAAALAAVSLAFGISAAVLVIATAEAHKIGTQTPNLSGRQIRVYPGPSGLPDFPTPRGSAELAHLGGGVRRLAHGVPGATVTPLAVAIQPGVAPQGSGTGLGVPTMQISAGSGGSFNTASVLYVATPRVLAYLGIDPATISPRTDFLLASGLDTSGLFIPSYASRKSFPIDHVQRIRVPALLLGFPDTSNRLAPPSFVTAGALKRLGWKQASSGWLVEAPRPLTGAQIAVARSVAARAGLTIETRRGKESVAGIALGAIIGGALLALGVLLITVSLIRSEAAADLRTLAAVGAGGGTRRTLTAASVGGLALVGALLGIAGAYLALVAAFLGDGGYLGHVPLFELAAMLFGAPVFVAVASWLLGGRERSMAGRAAIE